MRISDWSSDVCSSDLAEIVPALERRRNGVGLAGDAIELTEYAFDDEGETEGQQQAVKVVQLVEPTQQRPLQEDAEGADDERSEEHTSELQSLMRISYADFSLKKTKQNTLHQTT